MWDNQVQQQTKGYSQSLISFPLINDLHKPQVAPDTFAIYFLCYISLDSNIDLLTPPPSVTRVSRCYSERASGTVFRCCPVPSLKCSSLKVKFKLLTKLKPPAILLFILCRFAVFSSMLFKG